MPKEFTGFSQKESSSNPPSDVFERIESYLSAAPIVLFMKGTRDLPACGFSAQVVAALRACNADFVDVNISEDPELRQALKEYSQWPTYPQLYIWHELVGGCDIVLELFRSGELARMVAASEDDGEGERGHCVKPH